MVHLGCTDSACQPWQHLGHCGSLPSKAHRGLGLFAQPMEAPRAPCTQDSSRKAAAAWARLLPSPGVGVACLVLPSDSGPSEFRCWIENHKKKSQAAAGEGDESDGSVGGWRAAGRREGWPLAWGRRFGWRLLLHPPNLLPVWQARMERGKVPCADLHQLRAKIFLGVYQRAVVAASLHVSRTPYPSQSLFSSVESSEKACTLLPRQQTHRPLPTPQKGPYGPRH